MSTKCSIDSGPGGAELPRFHFYTDLYDPGTVYLEMRDAGGFPLKFEATAHEVTVGIPVKLWRRLAGHNLTEGVGDE